MLQGRGAFSPGAARTRIDRSPERMSRPGGSPSGGEAGRLDQECLNRGSNASISALRQQAAIDAPLGLGVRGGASCRTVVDRDRAARHEPTALRRVERARQFPFRARCGDATRSTFGSGIGTALSSERV